MDNLNNTMSPSVDDGLRNFFRGIYGWMFGGVLVSALFAYLATQTHYFDFIFQNKMFFYGVLGLELVLMLGIQFMINKISPQVAGILFFLYAGLTGVTISVIFSYFALNSILIIFGTTVVIFALLAIIGFTTKKDLSGWGTFLFVGMIGVIIASLANMYFQNGLFDIVISAISVLVFAGLTVYDNQAYKNIYFSLKEQGLNEEQVDRFTVLGALHMYINFIVMFQNLLHLFGDND